MTMPPTNGQPPTDDVMPAPSPSVNNDTRPNLPPASPPGGYTRPDYWAVPPQPQAPGWPYAGVPPYGVAPPPFPPGPPITYRETIGPNHVPWRFRDVLLAALPFILLLTLTLVSHFASSTATSTTTDTPTSTPVLIANTVIGLVIYGIILLLVWAVTVRKYRVGWSALGLRRPPGLFWWLVLPIFVAMLLAANYVSILIIHVFYGGKATNPQVKDITGGGSFSWTKLILALITASIAAPFVEEIFFRGVLFGWLRTRWGAVPGVSLSAALFSGAHAIPLILASIFVVGLTLALVYEKTKSTIATMALHSLFNTIGVVAVFIDLARK
ncbi:MAG: CPBP family glutamic-type intramembrane protease [Thermomicrobiales bacterium]